MALVLSEDGFGNLTADMPGPRGGKAVNIMAIWCEDTWWVYADARRVPVNFPLFNQPRMRRRPSSILAVPRGWIPRAQVALQV